MVATNANFTTMAPTSTSPYPMSSLYVGDLHPDVVEATLYDRFSTIGPVLSIRVCRDAITRRSLGYAYVNFQLGQDAKQAMETLNYESFNGKPIRIMWSNRDPSSRRSSSANIYIKNLDKGITNRQLYDTFALFGNILSCKVATDENGVSKGYGFVHFEEEAGAQQAINKVNGMLIFDRKVFVGRFQSRSARMKDIGDMPKVFTNVFVKNFGDYFNKESLANFFSKFGKITSSIVMLDAEEKSKGFGFVAFENPESAAKAVEELDGCILPNSDHKITVCRAQKKSERSAELKQRFEQLKVERIERYKGVNVYVKNLDETFNDEKLKELFASFGNITSAKVMVDEEGRSKGFAFVCFEKPEEATKAVDGLNGKLVFSKPLYVALAQRKDDRRAQLALQYMHRVTQQRLSNGMSGTVYAPSSGYFVPNQNLNVPQRSAFVPATGPMHGSMRPTRWQYPPHVGYNMQTPYTMGDPNFASPRRMNSRPMHYNQNPLQGVQRPQNMSARPRQHGHAYVAAQPRQPAPTSGMSSEALSTQLASADAQQQKQMLGEQIYAKLDKNFGSKYDIGKITGMLLEFENSELLMLLNDDAELRSRVEQAAGALHGNVEKATGTRNRNDN